MKHQDEQVVIDALTQTLAPSDVEMIRPHVSVLLRYLERVLDINRTINLTAVREWDSALRLHLIDSLVAVPEIMGAPEGPYADIGTGGGFPGVPLAVVSGRRSLLADSVRKKCEAVERALQDVALSGSIETYPGRAEDLSRERPDGFACVSARAVAELPALLELAAPLLILDGAFVALKGRIDADEIDRADRVAKLVGMEPTSSRTFSLPGGDEFRTILTYRKCGKASVALPRRVGLAQHQPLA